MKRQDSLDNGTRDAGFKRARLLRVRRLELLALIAKLTSRKGGRPASRNFLNRSTVMVTSISRCLAAPGSPPRTNGSFLIQRFSKRLRVPIRSFSSAAAPGNRVGLPFSTLIKRADTTTSSLLISCYIPYQKLVFQNPLSTDQATAVAGTSIYSLKNLLVVPISESN